MLPTRSLTHFFVKLVFAAPNNFFSAAAASHATVASRSHFVKKLVFDAPASFFSSAEEAQVAFAAMADDVMMTASTAARTIVLIRILQ